MLKKCNKNTQSHQIKCSAQLSNIHRNSYAVNFVKLYKAKI